MNSGHPQETGEERSVMAVEAALPPVIDMSKFPAELEKLATASTRLGCFRVANHGIPAAMMAEIKAAIRSLCEIPTESKLRNTEVILGSGYAAPSPLHPLMESFGIYDAASAADMDAFCLSLDVSPSLRDIICTYTSKVHALSVEIASKVADSLGLLEYSFKDWTCLMRLNQYSFTKKYLGSPGMKAHTDSSFITLIQEDESVGGLEIMEPSGSFVAVDPVPSTFLVLVGDVAKAWSNGRLHNVAHRVQCKEVGERISVVFTMFAPQDDKIKPRAEFIDSVHPQLYDAFIFDDYRKLRHSSGLRTGQALPLLPPHKDASTPALSIQ